MSIGGFLEDVFVKVIALCVVCVAIPALLVLDFSRWIMGERGKN